MNQPWGYGGTIPEHFTDQQRPRLDRKKNPNRLNDQLIPKPTDINVGENMTKIPIPREHPYSSHISRFAMFPSFRSPDDADTGVRAAARPFFNLRIPSGAQEVTVRSKTKGSPYRHEILESPARSCRKPITWTGDHGFMKGEKQVYYPTPPKTILPNLKLRDWDLSLSERTSNMLRNLERSHWLTSYQMDYTGRGPANPLKIDDFQERMSSLPGINSHRAPLRERSSSSFVPSNPKRGLRSRRGSPVRGAGSPSDADHQHPGPSHTAEAQNQAQEIPAEASRGGLLGPSGDLAGLSGERPPNPSGHQHSPGKAASSGEKGQAEPRGIDLPKSKNVTFNISGDEAEVSCRPSWDSQTEGRDPGRAASNPGGPPRPPPGVSVGRGHGGVSLLELQNSFSKSEAHRKFNSSVAGGAVDLRDNVVTGKKHNFFGINCNYIHG